MKLQRKARVFCWALMMTLAPVAVSGAEGDFRLSGVLISNSSRVALINGELMHEGDRIAGAEIVTIREGEVQILVGADRMTVSVGASLSLDQDSFRASRRSFAKAAKEAVEATARKSSVELVDNHVGVPPTVAGEYRVVAYGESLSGIAQEYAGRDVTIDQVMIALFDANPDAFGDNINLLYEGAVLKVPATGMLHLMTAADAAAEVAKQSRIWRDASPGSALPADNAIATEYGPVEYGETLSEIAEQLIADDVTLNQMMIVLYRTNPAAFGDNIHLLHAGATLSIPNISGVNMPTEGDAIAMIIEHDRARRQIVSNPAGDDVLQADLSTTIASSRVDMDR